MRGTEELDFNNGKLNSKSNSRDYSHNDVVIETGGIFFFYRPKMDAKEVKDIEDIQRFYMITAKDINKAKGGSKKFRLFLLGSKKMPEIVEGESTSEERNWALNILSSSNSEKIRNELLSKKYMTKTRGKRTVPVI